MSSHFKGHLGRVLATIAVLCAFGTLAAAQYQPAPKWELYGGYSFWYPGADVHGTLPLGLVPLSSRMEANPRGAGAAVTYNFNRWFGLTLDASDHWGEGEKTVAKTIDDASFSNISLGPKVTFRSAHFSPFLEALVGDHRLTPAAFHDIDKLGFMVGGGLDINLTRHVALRLLRADFVMSNYRFGPSTTTPSTDLRGVRLQTGLVFMFGGGAPPLSPSAACSVQPTEVFAGEPVSATAVGSNFNPKRTVKYNWSGTGVKVSGSSASTQIDTTGLQPGSYQVAAKLSDGSSKGMASCNASFTVRAMRPPVISCSPDPASVPMGGSSTISSIGSSPDNRILTYSYTTSAGSITGNTTTATLDTTSVQPGTITVTCTVTDDRNPPLTASFIAAVNVQAAAKPPAAEVQAPPPPTAIEQYLAIRSIYFATDKPSIKNPDGGLMPSQEATLTKLASSFKTYLESKPDAILTLEGHADQRGSVAYNQALSERRVESTKRLLVDHGVPAASIQTKAYGKQHNLTEAEVKNGIEKNPEVSPEDRKKLLAHLKTIQWASNRRVDITLTATGQTTESVRDYPFNAEDSLILLSPAPPSKKRGATKKQ